MQIHLRLVPKVNIPRARADRATRAAARAADFLHAAGPKGGMVLAKLLTTRAKHDDYLAAPGPRGGMVMLNDLAR